MYLFDVALWRLWPDALPIVEFIEAPSRVEALEQVMRMHGLFKCARAAVALCESGFIVRYDHPLLTAEGELEAEFLLSAA